jgi:hypothetical protein
VKVAAADRGVETEQNRNAAAGAPLVGARERALARTLARNGAAGLAGVDRQARARLVRSLQRAHGNAAVQRMAAGPAADRRCACGGLIGPDGECTECKRKRQLDRRVLARTVTYDECSASQQTDVAAAHGRANAMLANAIDKLTAYDGTNPPEVKTALQKHFNSSSMFVARIVKTNLVNLRGEMGRSFDPQYECQGADSGTTLAWVPWCVPLADIEVYPRFFTKSLDKRASTLVHEWFHKYLCKLDVGYEHEDGYEDQSTLRHLTNADSFGELVYDVR